jgi:hypothetical protein
LYARFVGCPKIRAGSGFSAAEQYRNFARLNAANWSDEAENAAERLGALTVGQKPGF